MANSKVGDLNAALSRSVEQGGFWERGFFTVPATVPHERVVFLADRYRRRFGNICERRGLKVHLITMPVIDPGQKQFRSTISNLPDELGSLVVALDRRKYLLFAWVSRKPAPVIFDIPDKFVPEFEMAGLRLLE